MYRLLIDGDHFIHGIDYDTFEEAKDSAFEVLNSWMTDALTDDEWDYMICNCSVEICKFDPETKQWDGFWYPDDEYLESIGWVERG